MSHLTQDDKPIKCHHPNFFIVLRMMTNSREKCRSNRVLKKQKINKERLITLIIQPLAQADTYPITDITSINTLPFLNQ
jgi:hypothetical protein